MRQTTVQNSNTIRFGSGKIEVGDTIESLVNLGAMKGVTFEETWDKVRIMSDNAGEIEAGIRNHKAGISGDLMEIELENISELRGGIDTYTTAESSQVNAYDYILSSGEWSLNTFIPLDNQPADNSESNFTINSISGGSDGSFSGGEGTDFHVVQNDDEEWGVIIDSDGTATTADQQLTINYDYTPAASQTLKSGGNRTISPKVVRITNEDENGNVFRITIYKATTEEGITIELPADNAEDPAVTPINLQGSLDESRTKGEQLFEIYDEQGVA